MFALQLTPSQVKKVAEGPVHQTFLRTEEITGVPWQAIAAIFYRESFSVATPKTPGGSFQFDPPPSKKIMEELLNEFTHLDQKAKDAIVSKGVNDFVSAAILAACWLRHSTKFVINTKSTDAEIKDALWAYNGRKYGSADKSPYVMSGYSDEHLNMVIKGTIPDANHPGLRIHIETVDRRPGAFVVYRQLKNLGSK